MTPIAELRFLDGIDRCETDKPEGWWETSVGADFGAGILAQIERLVSDKQATIDRLTGERDAAEQRYADMQAIVMDTIEKRRMVYVEKQKRADPMADDDRNQHDCLRDRIMALDYLSSEMEAALAQTGRG